MRRVATSTTSYVSKAGPRDRFDGLRRYEDVLIGCERIRCYARAVLVEGRDERETVASPNRGSAFNNCFEMSKVAAVDMTYLVSEGRLVRFVKGGVTLIEL